jgi:hypothetical protein
LIIHCITIHKRDVLIKRLYFIFAHTLIHSQKKQTNKIQSTTHIHIWALICIFSNRKWFSFDVDFNRKTKCCSTRYNTHAHWTNRIVHIPSTNPLNIF